MIVVAPSETIASLKATAISIVRFGFLFAIQYFIFYVVASVGLEPKYAKWLNIAIGAIGFLVALYCLGLWKNDLASIRKQTNKSQ